MTAVEVLIRWFTSRIFNQIQGTLTSSRQVFYATHVDPRPWSNSALFSNLPEHWKQLEGFLKILLLGLHPHLAWGSAWISRLFVITPGYSNVLPKLRTVSLWGLLRGQNKVDILIDRWFSHAGQIAFFQFVTLGSSSVVMSLKHIPQPQTSSEF